MGVENISFIELVTAGKGRGGWEILRQQITNSPDICLVSSRQYQSEYIKLQ